MSQLSRLVSSGRRPVVLALLGVAALGLSGCGGKERPRADLAASQVTTIGVNSYLWRASLDALSFMPLLQADSAGGVIIPGWYKSEERRGGKEWVERCKSRWSA